MEKKILVVDDELTLRELLDEAFRKLGYEVQTAESAEAALEILKDESIMVMILDLNMPGMNGIDLCRAIRKENPVAFIFALTGHTDLFGLLNCRRAGFDSFFTKPAKLDDLANAVEFAFRQLQRWEVDNLGLI